MFVPARTVMFTGHRTISAAELIRVDDWLTRTIRSLAKQGLTDYISGAAVGFDTIAAEKVIALRPELGLHLMLALPCLGQDIQWQDEKRRRHTLLLEQADRVELISDDDYSEGCMLKRNRFMVNSAAFCLSYYRGTRGGTSFTVRLATEHGLKMLNLYPLCKNPAKSCEFEALADASADFDLFTGF